MEKYLTPVEAAEVLRCSRRTLYNYLAAGLIKAHCPAGRWRITEQAVRDFAEGRDAASAAPTAAAAPQVPVQSAPKPPPMTLKQMKGRPRR